MTSRVTGFFWSYTHRDNELTHGRITELANLIKNEYKLQTQEELDIFIDSDISWGEGWRDRISRGLADSSFFIPVITPGYFLSTECRRELRSFAAQSQSLGIQELILPILFVWDTPDLTEDSHDEAVALIARMQYEDWRELRFEDVRSPRHVLAISRLVNKLREIAARVIMTAASGNNDSRIQPMGADTPIVLDVVADLEESIPGWGQTFVAMNETMEQLYNLAKAMPSDLAFENLHITTGAASARRKVLQDFAEKTMPLCRQLRDHAISFDSDILKLDAGILTLIRAAETANPAEDFVEFACSLILGIAPTIIKSFQVVKRKAEDFHILAAVSRVMQPPTNVLEASTRQLGDSVARIEEWVRRIETAGRTVPDFLDSGDVESDDEGGVESDDK